MNTATVRVTPATRDLLRELAERMGKSMQAVIEEAVEAYRWRTLTEVEAGPKPASTEAGEDLADDPNFLAFTALSSDFVAQNAGRFAAFCGGELVALAADKPTLFARLDREHPDEPCLVQELATGQPRTVRFRRPRRIHRPGSTRSEKHPPPP